MIVLVTAYLKTVDTGYIPSLLHFTSVPLINIEGSILFTFLCPIKITIIPECHAIFPTQVLPFPRIFFFFYLYVCECVQNVCRCLGSQRRVSDPIDYSERWLKVLATLPEDPRLIPSMVVHIYSGHPSVFFWPT